MVAVPPPAPPVRPAPARPVSGGPRRFASLRTVTALILREMSTRYGRTPGGYLWAIAEPLGAIVVLSIGFSLVLRTPSLGNSFLLFYATGYLVFNLFNSVANTTARAINFSKPLLKYPAVTWLDAVLARFLLTSLTGIVIAIVLLTGILSVIDSHTTVNMVPVVEAFALAMLLGLGVGVTNCALMGLFPLWDVAWSIITRPLFLASAIIYIYEDLPPVAKEILWYNPLIHITGLMRRGFYSTYTAAHVTPLYPLFFGLAFLALGLLLLGRYHREILNR